MEVENSSSSSSSRAFLSMRATPADREETQSSEDEAFTALQVPPSQPAGDAGIKTDACNTRRDEEMDDCYCKVQGDL